MNLLAIDPGQRGCGVALFDSIDHRGDAMVRFPSGEPAAGLVRAAYVHNPVKRGDGAESWAALAQQVALWAYDAADPVSPTRNEFSIVVEIPRVYPGPRQKGDQNDLIALAAVAGAIVGRLGAVKVRRVYPRDWKGTVDPDVMTERIRSRLTPAELRRLEPCPKSLEHNMLDAVGIGLHAVGRLEPRRVIAR